MIPKLPKGSYFTKGPKGKKYTAHVKKGSKYKKVHFGNEGSQHYKDQTTLKLYSHLDHGDKERRDNYRARHSKIKLKDGSLAYKTKYTPSWFSWWFLW